MENSLNICNLPSQQNVENSLKKNCKSRLKYWFLMILNLTFFNHSTLFAQREVTLNSTQTIQASQTNNIRAAKIDDTHVLFAYKDGSLSSSSDLVVRIGEVNTGTGAITFGAEATVESSDNNHTSGIVVLSSTSAVIAYELDGGAGTDDGKARVLTLDTSSDEVTVNSAASLGTDLDAAFSHNTIPIVKLTSTQFALVYSDNDNTDNGVVRIGTVSGTSVSFGSDQTFSTGDVQNMWIDDLSSTKIVITFEDDGGSDHGKAIIGDVTLGTSTVSFGSEHTFNFASTSYTSCAAISSTQFAVAYVDDDANDFLHSKVGTVSGTTITYSSSEFTIENGQDTRDITSDYIQGSEFVVAFNGGFGDTSKVRVGEVSGTGTSATISYNTADIFLESEADDSWVINLDDENIIISYVDDESATPNDGEAIVGSFDTPVPVELTSFSALIKDDSIELLWETATEVNNFGFEIERYTPLVSDIPPSRGESRGVWEKIGFIPGHGNSNSPKSYSFNDIKSFGRKVYYRLKQIDFNGSFEFSNIIEINLEEEVPANFVLNQNFPNPFNPETVISYKLSKESNVELIVFDLLGNKIKDIVDEKQQAGSYSYNFNASELASGTYIYKLNADNNNEVKKMILIK